MGLSEQEVVQLINTPTPGTGDSIVSGKECSDDSYDVLWRYNSFHKAIVGFKNEKVVGYFYFLKNKKYKSAGTMKDWDEDYFEIEML